jgi:hypothetical protein
MNIKTHRRSQTFDCAARWEVNKLVGATRHPLDIIKLIFFPRSSACLVHPLWLALISQLRAAPDTLGLSAILCAASLHQILVSSKIYETR